jgi:cytochrome P450
MRVRKRTPLRTGNTTACLLTWTFLLLARHPQALENLQGRISKVDSNTDLARNSLRNVKYLQNLLKESQFSQAHNQRL